ncbi:uncharacterized protein [Henckelia pumila]|uniref:uncharacterized protein n=1 Tax=Henckelia pumila TaxID=405737 RepID=UPI003C6E83FA
MRLILLLEGSLYHLFQQQPTRPSASLFKVVARRPLMSSAPPLHNLATAMPGPLDRRSNSRPNHRHSVPHGGQPHAAHGPPSSSAVAYTATSPGPFDGILDSRATHHVIADLSNLSLHTLYVGFDGVIVGDGNGLPITHTSCLLPPSSSPTLLFSHALCVPSINKNLLSVSQICKTNDVIVDFSSSDFQVQDPRTGDILHQGPLKDGVYSWSASPFSPPLALSASSAYFCYKLSSGRVFVSRHVVFVEFTFHFASGGSANGLCSGTPRGSPVEDPRVLDSLPVESFDPCPARPLHLPLSPNVQPDPAPILAARPSPEPPATHAVPPSKPPPPPPDSNTHPMNTGYYNIFWPNTRFGLIAITDTATSEPTSHTLALKDPHWRAAMSEEFDALLRNVTWDLVPSDMAQNVVGCKWVFRRKRKSEGSIDRYKALLGQLDECVYMAQPPGFIDSDFPAHVSKLNKEIYGLKQAPRACVIMYLLFYVDDLILTGNDVAAL